MKRPININNIDKYMLMVEDDNTFYLMKHKGEVKITAKRALEWLEAGIQTFNASADTMKEIIKEELK